MKKVLRFFFYSSRGRFNSLCNSLIILWFFCSSVPAFATNYYIAPNGNDFSNGTTITSPMKTWTAASAKMAPGDTLYARGGPTFSSYSGQGGWNGNENNNWMASGTQGNPVTFKAYPGETPVFYGNVTQSFDSTYQSGYRYQNGVGVGLVISGHSWVIVNGLTFTYYSGVAAISLSDNDNGAPSHITIQNCIIHDRGGNDGVNKDHGIYISNACTDTTIRNNIVYKYSRSCRADMASPGRSKYLDL